MRATRGKITISEAIKKQRAANEVVSPINYNYGKCGNKQDNAELLKRYRLENDEEALSELVQMNTGLVNSCASKFIGALNSSLDFDDLMQFGSLGLITAAKKFDMDRIDEIAFSTYAIWWIRQSIGRGIADTGTSVRIPVHIYEKYNKVLKAERLAITNGDTFSDIDLEKTCKTVGISVDVYESIKYISSPLSLNIDLNENEDGGSELIDFVASSDNIEEEVELKTRTENLVEDIAPLLTERELDVLKRRFGLDDGIPMSLQECGDSFGLTRERIRQIEMHALRKLKNSLEFRSKYSPKKMSPMEEEMLKRRLFAKQCRDAVKKRKEEIAKLQKAR